MRHKLLALAAIGAAGLTTAGCGGSSSNSGLSYSAFSQAANNICKDGDTALKALDSLHPTSLAGVVAPLKQGDSVIDGVIGKLQGLKGPSALTSARDTYVADFQQASSDIKSMISAAQSNSLSGFKSGALAFQALKGKAKTDGSKLGATACST